MHVCIINKDASMKKSMETQIDTQFAISENIKIV